MRRALTHWTSPAVFAVVACLTMAAWVDAQVIVTAGYAPAYAAPVYAAPVPVVAYRPVAPVVAPAPVVAYSPVVAPAPVVAYSPVVAPAVVAPTVVARPVITTRWRPILGGTVTRVRYHYAPGVIAY